VAVVAGPVPRFSMIALWVSRKDAVRSRLASASEMSGEKRLICFLIACLAISAALSPFSGRLTPSKTQKPLRLVKNLSSLCPFCLFLASLSAPRRIETGSLISFFPWGISETSVIQTQYYQNTFKSIYFHTVF